MKADRIPVSAIVMTKNEESHIGTCLRSLSGFDEVFVVDSGSTDGTWELAGELGAHVVSFVWNGAYPKKKQWCLENLPFRNDWVIYVDADEEMSPALSDEIASVMAAGPRAAGYFAGYDGVFLGKRLRHGHRVYKLILLDRNRAHYPPYDDLDVGNPLEIELHFQPRIQGETRMLKARMVHHDFDSLFHWIARHNAYSDWEALLRLRGELPRKDDTQPGIRRALKVAFNRLPAKGSWAFLWSYVFRLGFLDGAAGLHYALGRAFYYWQVGLKMRERGGVGR